MKKFIIIEHEPLTVRLRDIWNIVKLQNKGVDVEYWDLSQYIFPGINIPNKVYGEYVRVIDSLCGIESGIAENDVTNTVFAIEVFPKWDNRKIFALLHKYNCFCIRIDLYANTTLPKSVRERIKSFLRRFPFIPLLKRCLWYCYFKINLKKIYELTLSSSTIANPDIKINHPDYERFQQISTPLLTSKYILFIDIYYPVHPDLQFGSKLKDVNKLTSNYRKTMNLFFDYISEKYDKEVVIAAHPKSEYIGNEFGNRKIIRDNTSTLVKYADMVLTHGSNAFSFIALANKPLMIIYPNSYKQVKGMYEYISQLSTECGIPAYNLDKGNWDEFYFSPMNEKSRKKYIYSFLTSDETKDKSNADIWIERFLKD